MFFNIFGWFSPPWTPETKIHTPVCVSEWAQVPLRTPLSLGEHRNHACATYGGLQFENRSKSQSPVYSMQLENGKMTKHRICVARTVRELPQPSEASRGTWGSHRTALVVFSEDFYTLSPLTQSVGRLKANHGFSTCETSILALRQYFSSRFVLKHKHLIYTC